MIAARAHQVKSVIPYQFIALPSEILRRPDLSAAAKLLVAVVMDNARSSRGGSCKLTNAGLGARIGRSAASVKRLLGELEQAGLVRRDSIAEKHQRTAVVPTWGVVQESTTEQTAAAQDRSTGGSETTHPPVQDRAAIQSPPSEPSFQTGPILSTSEDGKPTPGEIADALRAMTAGRYSPQLFDGKTTSAPPVAGEPSPDVRVMARRVGYSAVALLSQTRAPRKTADQQLRELAEWSRRHSPAPPARPSSSRVGPVQFAQAGNSSGKPG